VAQGQGFRSDQRRWSRGDRLPPEHRRDDFAVQDWRRHNLPPPPRGYRWYCRYGGHCFLVATRTGVIRDAYWRDDRERYWRDRYARRYSYYDDIYYRECRSRPDPAGILIGGLIGGLLGQALSDGERDGSVFAGIIIGGVLGAALTRDMDCEDRSYAYRSFYRGLNAGYPGSVHRWHNPRNGHHGEFRVRSYYYDPYGFHCANYAHTAWLERRRVANGRACRQPDGAWAFLN
jgi:surface antigen